MPETSKPRHYPVELAERNEGDWIPYERLDGSQYHVKMRAGDEPSSSHCTLVVDDWRQKPTADNKSNSLASGSCEEAYFRGEDEWLLIIHSSQTAWYLVPHKEADLKTKQKLYWTYIYTHPAHAQRSMAGWMAAAHIQALVYLKWCSFEAMTSPSTTKVPFALTASQELANMLASLHEKSVYSKDGEAGAAVDTPGVRGAQPGIALPHPVDDHPVPAAGTAAQESFKLRTALIAKVLAAKYSQQAIRDPSIVPYNQHTSTHKGIALVLGLPLAALVCSLPSSGGRLSLTEPSGIFYAVVATVVVGGLARYSLAGL